MRDIFRKLMDRFREKPSTLTIDIPVRDHTGVIAGWIRFSPDGTFDGKLITGTLRRLVERTVSMDLCEGISMTPDIKQPQPPWKKRI